MARVEEAKSGCDSESPENSAHSKSCCARQGRDDSQPLASGKKAPAPNTTKKNPDTSCVKGMMLVLKSATVSAPCVCFTARRLWQGGDDDSQLAAFDEKRRPTPPGRTQIKAAAKV